MPKATPTPGSSLLSPTDHSLVLIDFQSQMAFATKSIAPELLRNNAALVSRAAKSFGVPTILTTVAEKSFSGPMFDEIVEAFDGQPMLDRTSMNTWEDAAVIDEVNRIGKDRIVFAGLWTSVCIVGPVASAIDQGFDVYFIADACGDISEEAHERAVQRMIQLGAKPMTSLQYLLELQRDWARTETYESTTGIAKKFGGRMKAMISGGAPLNPEVGLFFESIGLTFLQGYGQTEAAPVISCNRPQAGVRMDSVGPPLKDTEVRIAEDGEILVRGELVMHGYWRNDAETAKVLRDGWLHTGDIGEIDANGRIRITDRKKDLIINDKGDNVAPQKVEGMLTLQREVAQAMIVGDKRPYMVALIVPDPEWTQEWCAANGDVCSFARLAENSEFRTAIGLAIERVNKDLTVTERVRRFVLADGPFTIENEQLTPSLKIRRHVLKQAYGERLDALYKP